MEDIDAQDGSSPGFRKWATGRILTKAQRERKRATDRITKRKRKDEAEKRFWGLESQVQDLSCQIEVLKNNAHATTSKSNALYTSPEETYLGWGACFPPSNLNCEPDLSITDSLVLSTQDAARPPTMPSPVSSQMLDNTVDKYATVKAGASTAQDIIKTLPPCASPSRWTLMTPDASIPDEDWLAQRPRRELLFPTWPLEGGMQGAFGESKMATQLSRVDQGISPTVYDCSPLETSVRSHLCSLLRQTQEVDSSSVCTSEALNQDALIRGITQGWSFVVATPESCPLWKILETIDGYILQDAEVLIRFCVLRLVHLTLQYSIQAIVYNRLPPWYRPRPSQHHVPHALAINMIPWPGMRERAIFDERLTASNKFWSDFISLMRFDWPYALSDAIWFQSEGRLWQFSGLFERYMGDIRRWEMDPTFFNAFPETFEDIMPCASGVSRMGFDRVLPDSDVATTSQQWNVT